MESIFGYLFSEFGLFHLKKSPICETWFGYRRDLSGPMEARPWDSYRPAIQGVKRNPTIKYGWVGKPFGIRLVKILLSVWDSEY